VLCRKLLFHRHGILYRAHKNKQVKPLITCPVIVIVTARTTHSVNPAGVYRLK
jgi:hypothetical protein